MSKSLLYLTLLLLYSVPFYGDDFTGSERCKLCHKEEYEKFSQTPHKDTSKSLNKEDRKNKECLMCHSMDGEGKYMEIGCEACHGSGKYYAQDYVMKDKELSRLIGLKIPDQESCKRCHTQDSPRINRLNLKDGMKMIEHKKGKKKEERKEKK